MKHSEYRVLKSGMEEGLRVFVAEDNAADLFWLEMVFKSCGLPYTIEVASDGDAAKDYLERFACKGEAKLDLIFLDVNLPLMTAFEILQAVPAAKELNYFLLSGSSSTEQKERLAVELGEPPWRFIPKPLTHDNLMDCLSGKSVKH